MKQAEIDVLVKTLQGLAEPDLPPPPPEPEKPKEPEKHPYITLNGKEPDPPKAGFLGSKLFITLGVGCACLVGVVIYFLLL